jgi:hypothetical protein
MKKFTQKEQIAFVKEMITTNKMWAQRALMRIFENQTQDERILENTSHENGIGFTSNDAKLLTSFANSLEIYGSLTDKQMTYLYRFIGKYAKQLYKSPCFDKEKLNRIMEKSI